MINRSEHDALNSRIDLKTWRLRPGQEKIAMPLIRMAALKTSTSRRKIFRLTAHP